MADRISEEKRSWNMSRIRGKDTKPEVLVRSFLFRKGFRFRKNVKGLPGKPDVVLPKYHTVIFVNGCFWHHHENCRYAYMPKTRTEFWETKFERNRINDIKNTGALITMGWKVITLWECELKNNFEKVLSDVINSLKGDHIT